MHGGGWGGRGEGEGKGGVAKSWRGREEGGGGGGGGEGGREGGREYYSKTTCNVNHFTPTVYHFVAYGHVKHLEEVTSTIHVASVHDLRYLSG